MSEYKNHPKGTLAGIYELVPAHPDLRDSHYIFSHITLRDFALKDPLKFFALMPGTQAADAMLDLWTHVTRDCGDADTHGLDFGELFWRPVAVNNHACVVFQMPRPHAPSEAWFVAVVLMEDMHDDQPFSDDPQIRYLQLEHDPGLEDAGGTALTEWRGDRWFSHGEGPKPDLYAFVRFLEGFVDYTQ